MRVRLLRNFRGRLVGTILMDQSRGQVDMLVNRLGVAEVVDDGSSGDDSGDAGDESSRLEPADGSGTASDSLPSDSDSDGESPVGATDSGQPQVSGGITTDSLFAGEPARSVPKRSRTGRKRKS